MDNNIPEKRSVSPLALVLMLSAFFFFIFILISGAFFLSKSSPISLNKTGSSAFFSGGDAVGVVEIKGVILDSKKTLSRLERFEENDQIKAVVLRLNSPGGAVAPSQEIYEAVKHYKKPLVVSMGSVAASGAYYIACGAKKVFANPGTLTGSIGVIMEFANLEKLYEWAKIQRYSVKTGRYKDIGAEYRPMTPEEHELLLTLIDDVLGQFKRAVASGRHLAMEQVTAIADGRILAGSQAKAIHLVDDLGTLKDAIDEAAKLGEIRGKPVVIYAEKKKRNLLDLLMDNSDGSNDDASSSLSQTTLGRILSLFEKLADPRISEAQREPGLYLLWRQGS